MLISSLVCIWVSNCTIIIFIGRQIIFYCAVLAERIMHSFKTWEAQSEEPKIKRIRAEETNTCKVCFLLIDVPSLTSELDDPPPLPNISH